MFTSSVTVGSPTMGGDGFFEYDSPNQRMNQSINIRWFGGNYLNITSLLLSDGGATITNGEGKNSEERGTNALGRCDQVNTSHFGDIFRHISLHRINVDI